MHRALEGEGKALWPDMFDSDKLLEIKKEIGTHAFSSQYMNEPLPAENALFKNDWLRFYDQNPDEIAEKNRGRIFMAVDPAISEAESADYTAIVVAAEDENENIYVLEKVALTKHTNLYDKDGDGTREKLVVYIEPIDKDGDIIKATGAGEDELWDLNRENGQAKLDQWNVEADELSKLWFQTMMRTNYRLTFDITGLVNEFKEPLTVKVVFTDYLTGKTFKQQHVIEP